jgi:hypothetical protein
MSVKAEVGVELDIGLQLENVFFVFGKMQTLTYYNDT